MKNELIKETAGIYIINYIVGGVSRAIDWPLCTNTENLLAKLWPHRFCALTLCSIHQKCGSFDFWCNHFYRERNNEDEPQCCNMMRTSIPISAGLITTWQIDCSLGNLKQLTHAMQLSISSVAYNAMQFFCDRENPCESVGKKECTCVDNCSPGCWSPNCW
jgi:hypothetical protein